MDANLPPIPDYVNAILDGASGDEEAWKIRWSRALQAAIDQKAEPAVIHLLVMDFVSAPSFDLAANFAWIGILQAAGYERAALADLLLDRFKVEDPNCDLEAIRRRDFLRYPPAWWLADPNDFVRFVEKEVVRNAEDILALNRDLAAKLDQHTADQLAARACRYAVRLSNPAAVETVMRLDLQIRLTVAEHMAVNAMRYGSAIHTVTELGFLVWAALETAHDHDPQASAIWRGLEEAIFWQKKNEPADPDRPYRVFRWVMKMAKEAPLEVELWPTRHMTDDEIKRFRFERFELQFRKLVEDHKFCFTRARQTEHGDDRRYEAIVEDRGQMLVFVDRPGPWRDEIQQGTEVIVPLRPGGKHDFLRDRTRGYFIHMHPVAPPTAEMLAAVEANHGVL